MFQQVQPYQQAQVQKIDQGGHAMHLVKMVALVTLVALGASFVGCKGKSDALNASTPAGFDLPIVVRTEAPIEEVTIAACDVDAPIPEDITMGPPAEDLPPSLKAFYGSWQGIWDTEEFPGSLPYYGGLPSFLIVEYIDPSKASVRYTWGDIPKYNVTRGGEKSHHEATILPDGGIRFGGRQHLTFRLNDETIAGESINGDGSLSRITMVRCEFKEVK